MISNETTGKEISVVIIQGPTAVGKSDLAIQLAQHFQTELISADSRQVYKFLDIGTAKPSQEEQEKVKYHFIDIITPVEEYSAGDFAHNAHDIIVEQLEKGIIPIIVGGTGFYIKSFLEGIFQSPDIPREIREKLKETAKEKGSTFLYEKLKKVDPSSAHRTNPNDLNRIIRALEVYEFTGKTITQLWNEKPSTRRNYRTLNILISEDREILYERINKRVDEMQDKGLLKEFENVLNMGYTQSSPGLNTVGYKELFSYLDGNSTLVQCMEEIKKHTRNYAKRQFTWYRKIDFDLTLGAFNINISDIINLIHEFIR
jgi:tRNA dimethylallyltransferase